MQKAHLLELASKLHGFMQRRMGPSVQICGRSGIPFAEVPFCTNPIYIWKGSYGNGEPKNAILVLVPKAYLAVRASKLPGFMQRRMGPSVQIFGKSGLPFAEVPCLHQSNLHMKRKLREWRTQKCNPCFGAESPPLSTGQ